MGASVRPDDHDRIAANVAKMRSGGASDAEVEQYLTQHEGLKPVAAPAHDYHAEFKSGALQKRMARENANDHDMAEAETPGLASLATGALANASQGVPGAELAQAGARSLVRGQPYKDALNDIRNTTAQIPTALKVGQRVAGALPLAELLPASGLASGAIVGGSEGLLNADLDQSAGQRLGSGAIGAVAGGIVGKGVEGLMTAGRVAAATPAAQRLQQMLAERGSLAKDMYRRAIELGQGKVATPALKAYVAKPEIAEIVSELQQTQRFANVDAHAPEMLDAIYKTLSDRASQIKRGLDAVTPNRPNIGRFREQEVQSLKDELLSAMERPGSVKATRTVDPVTTAQSPKPSLQEALNAFHERAAEAARRARGGAAPNTNPFSSRAAGETTAQRTARQLLERGSAEREAAPAITGKSVPHEITEETHLPAVMPTYRHAVDTFAEKSGNIGALRRGADIVRTKLGPQMPSGRNLDRTTPEAFAKWAQGAPASERQAAADGILGEIKTGFDITKPLKSVRAVTDAPGLLRAGQAPRQSLIDMLVQQGIIAGDNAVKPD